MSLNLVIPADSKISFPIAGGLGAQIFGAATAFYLRLLGKTVNVDLRYFDLPPLSSLPGSIGIPSIWSWELGNLGVTKDAVSRNAADASRSPITPGIEWLSAVGSLALQDAQVLKKFSVPIVDEVQKALRLSFCLSETYTAVHLRRGDYLNCASFVLPASAAYDCAYRASRYTRNLVVISDSPIDRADLCGLSQKFSAVDILVDRTVSPVILWALLTYARVLITSNSQFSISAGYFSHGVVFAPDRYVSRTDAMTNRLYTRNVPFFLYQSESQEPVNASGAE